MLPLSAPLIEVECLPFVLADSIIGCLSVFKWMDPSLSTSHERLASGGSFFYSASNKSCKQRTHLPSFSDGGASFSLSHILSHDFLFPCQGIFWWGILTFGIRCSSSPAPFQSILGWNPLPNSDAIFPFPNVGAYYNAFNEFLYSSTTCLPRGDSSSSGISPMQILWIFHHCVNRNDPFTEFWKYLNKKTRPYPSL